MKILLHVTSEKIWPESGLSTVNITNVLHVCSVETGSRVPGHTQASKWSISKYF